MAGMIVSGGSDMVIERNPLAVPGGVLQAPEKQKARVSDYLQAEFGRLWENPALKECVDTLEMVEKEHSTDFVMSLTPLVKGNPGYFLRSMSKSLALDYPMARVRRQDVADTATLLALGIAGVSLNEYREKGGMVSATDVLVDNGISYGIAIRSGLSRFSQGADSARWIDAGLAFLPSLIVAIAAPSWAAESFARKVGSAGNLVELNLSREDLVVYVSIIKQKS